MVLAEILAVLRGVPQLAARNDDDFTDRLNHRYTSAILVVFAFIVSTKQLVGGAITCWAPKHFTGAWEDYANSFCWIKNTYYVNWEDEIPKKGEEKENPIIYYQWVSLILLCQAFMFYVPCMIWRCLNGKTGIDLNDIVETAEKFTYTDDAETKRKVLYFLTRQMDRSLGLAKRMRKRAAEESFCEECTLSLKWIISRTCCFLCNRKKANYMTLLYFSIKVLYIINAVSQLFILNAFLGHDYSMYGILVIQDVLAGRDWTNSPKFPRVTMCDFSIRRLGNVHRYTLQCVLPINLFNEKIYLFIWFWLLFIAIVTIVGLISWIIRTIAVDRYLFIKKHLSHGGSTYRHNHTADKKMLRQFVHQYLRQDGVFVLRLIGHNTDGMTLTEILCSLWQFYSVAPESRKLLGNGIIEEV